jgi:hypothetical protein
MGLEMPLNISDGKVSNKLTRGARDGSEIAVKTVCLNVLTRQGWSNPGP